MIKKLIPLWILISVSLCAQQRPESSQEASMWRHFTYDMGSVFKRVGYSYSRPLHWGGSQWATFGGVVAATGTAYLFDTQVSDYFIGIKDDIPPFIQEYGRVYGGPVGNAILSGAVYSTGLFTKNAKLRRTGVLMLSSTSSAALLQTF